MVVAARAVNRLCMPKIRYDDPPGRTHTHAFDEAVMELDVTVDEALLVEVAEAAGDLGGDVLWMECAYCVVCVT